MQGIFAGRTQLRYPYGRYGYTRGETKNGERTLYAHRF